MTRTLFFKLLVVFLLLPILLLAEPTYSFRSLSVSDGLSDNKVYNIYKDADGFLWFRTEAFMNRYDGVNFKLFHQPTSLQSDLVSNASIFYESNKEGLIFSTNNENLSIFDPVQESYLTDVQGFFRKLGLTETVRMVFIDSDKNYWLRTASESFFLYDVNKKELIRILDGASRYWMQEGFIQAVLKVGKKVWIMTDSGVLKGLDFPSRKLVSQDNYLLGRNLNTFSKKMNSIRLILCPDAAGNLYVLHDRGVFFHEPAKRKWTDLFPGYANKVCVFTSMALDKDGNLWVGTGQEGIFVIGKGNRNISHFISLQVGYGTYIMNDISSIYIDEDNGVWVGTLNAGVCYYHKNLNKFRQIRYPMSSVNSNGPFKNIKCFAEDPRGIIHVGTVDGVYLFDPKTGNSSQLEAARLDKVGLNNVWIKMLCDSRGRIWMASFYFGLICDDRGKISIFRNEPSKPNSIPENQIRSIYIDSRNRFWVAPLNYGVGIFDPTTGRFDRLIDRYPEMQNHRHVASMCELPGGDILFLSTKGLFKFESKSGRLNFSDPELLRISRSLAQINNAYLDSRGLLWFCTQDGLCLYDQKHKITVFHTEDGLPNNCVQSIEEDKKGILWLGTSKGLSRLEVNNKEGKIACSFTNYSEYDGLQGLPFNFHAHLKAKDGTMYFGGSNGFNYFKPLEAYSGKKILNPVITGLNLFGKPVVQNREYNGRIILKNAIGKVQRIKLHYDENFLSLEFSALNYLEPGHTVYRYRLEGLDQDWVLLRSREGRATYTDLKPGSYTFRVIASTNGKDWDGREATVAIVIRPPFWASALARFFYLLLAIYLFYQLLEFFRRRNQKKLEEHRERERASQKEELDQMKFRFFTNISHEFRTPLTLILTPLENMVQHLGESVPLDIQSLKQQLASIHRNAQNLLSLVNQLLDFRKLEMAGVELRLNYGDMVDFTRLICAEFAELAKTKNIYLSFETLEKSIYMGFDKEKMQKILNNLLSNALKFTPSTGEVKVEMRKEPFGPANKEMLLITVEDSGEGISSADLPHIFERFYQSKRENEQYLGSGIGLHLVREYVDLHHGEVVAESEPGKGSSFTLYFPLDLLEVENMPTESVLEQPEAKPMVELEGPQDRRTILLVEDNSEFRQFLKEQLSRLYVIYEAPDGVAGMDFAVEHQPDLIVSDLMMPRRDGLEFCRMLKSDLRTSHIPFILLTARSAEDVKLTGYEVGADYYLTKPFNLDILLVRINSLIENQRNRQEYFRKTIEVEPSQITITSLDEKLMHRCIGLVEEHMENAEYSVDDLANDVGISRGHLYRKLLAITGKSPVEFIRILRLKRAAQLLHQSQLSVNEVAYSVGFNNPKYFRKYFKDEFGVSPSMFKDPDNQSAEN
ncbi:MAG TPA: two-component regulator propeller domain-containing protein [Bacteroidales bacterium]|nr:two-component regulator propeller domain-containing protein [Bacteroidales bacterium]